MRLDIGNFDDIEKRASNVPACVQGNLSSGWSHTQLVGGLEMYSCTQYEERDVRASTYLKISI